MAEQAEKEAANVGVKIRSLRKIRGISLQQMAEDTGMSYSYLSGLENGKHSISLTNLQRFADYFQVNMIHFLQTRKSATTLVRRHDARDINTSDGIAYNVVTSENARNLQISYVYMPAHAPSERHIHKHSKGQEFIVALDGAVTVMVEDEHYVLEAGDSILFESEVEHTIFTEDVPANIILVSSPPYGIDIADGPERTAKKK